MKALFTSDCQHCVCQAILTILFDIEMAEKFNTLKIYFLAISFYEKYLLSKVYDNRSQVYPLIKHVEIVRKAKLNLPSSLLDSVIACTKCGRRARLDDILFPLEGTTSKQSSPDILLILKNANEYNAGEYTKFLYNSSQNFTGIECIL